MQQNITESMKISVECKKIYFFKYIYIYEIYCNSNVRQS